MRKKTRAAAIAGCLLSAFALGFALFGGSAKAEGNYSGEVLMSGQYSGSTSATNHQFDKEEARSFTDASDELGDASEHEGLYNHLRTNFVGWSDQKPADNGDIASGARFFLAKDTIADAFPDGLSGGEKLYAVYVNIDVPDTSNFLGLLGWLGSEETGELYRNVNDANSLNLNTDISPEDTLPDTSLVSEKSDASTGKIVDEYKASDDVNTINEVVLDSAFSMNPRVALLVYKDPTFGYEGKGVLTENYSAKFAAAGDFGTEDGSAAGYTYTDLNVELPEGATLPETLYLETESYFYRPLYVLSGGNKLTVVDPATGAELGNDKNSLTSLVSGTDPKTRFGVKVAPGTRDLKIRMILRTNGYSGEGKVERIDPAAITPANGKSRAELVASPMRLRLLPKQELSAILPNATDETLNVSVLRISDAKAKELAATDGETTLPFTGNIQGVARASIGTHRGFTLERYVNIDRVDVAVGRQIGYVMPAAYDELEFTSVENIGGDILLGDETEHDAVHVAAREDKLDFTGRLDVRRVKEQIKEAEQTYGRGIVRPEDIRLSNVEGTFTAVVNLPEGLALTDSGEAVLEGANDYFEITSVDVEDQTATVVMKLKNTPATFAELKEMVLGMDDDLFVTFRSTVFTDDAQADTNYTVRGTFNGRFKADATVDSFRKIVHFDYTWNAKQIPDGADFIAPDSEEITYTVKYLKKDVEENTDPGNGKQVDKPSDDPKDRQPSKDNIVKTNAAVAPATGDRNMNPAVFAVIAVISLGALGFVALAAWKKRNNR